MMRRLALIALVVGALLTGIWFLLTGGRGRSSADYIVHVSYGTSPCTGSLMTGGEMVVTAAHCATNGSVFVRSALVSKTAASCVTHPAYAGRDPFYDLAVCRLTTAASGVPTATLESPMNVKGSDVTYTGYGLTAWFAWFRFLHSVGEATGRVTDVVAGILVIAGDPVYGGDSGGPVTVAAPQDGRIAGVISCYQGKGRQPRAASVIDDPYRTWVVKCLDDWEWCQAQKPEPILTSHSLCGE